MNQNSRIQSIRDLQPQKMQNANQQECKWKQKHSEKSKVQERKQRYGNILNEENAKLKQASIGNREIPILREPNGLMIQPQDKRTAHMISSTQYGRIGLRPIAPQTTGRMQSTSPLGIFSLTNRRDISKDFQKQNSKNLSALIGNITQKNTSISAFSKNIATISKSLGKMRGPLTDYWMKMSQDIQIMAKSWEIPRRRQHIHK
ncbi:hypothetical protein FGO68_gene5093 [Halteria grandinella]|uniref:Uncharacterized protein n=1 Tax=Halteria grandinella TaxID=5974 RepID=A0A8J8NKE2_HALGN|nr:hypothetical protein FGO68_gene5093 [Halteria grandinella]